MGFRQSLALRESVRDSSQGLRRVLEHALEARPGLREVRTVRTLNATLDAVDALTTEAPRPVRDRFMGRADRPLLAATTGLTEASRVMRGILGIEVDFQRARPAEEAPPTPFTGPSPAHLTLAQAVNREGPHLDVYLDRISNFRHNPLFANLVPDHLGVGFDTKETHLPALYLPELAGLSTLSLRNGGGWQWPGHLSVPRGTTARADHTSKVTGDPNGDHVLGINFNLHGTVARLELGGYGIHLHRETPGDYERSLSGLAAVRREAARGFTSLTHPKAKVHISAPRQTRDESFQGKNPRLTPAIFSRQDPNNVLALALRVPSIQGGQSAAIEVLRSMGNFTGTPEVELGHTGVPKIFDTRYLSDATLGLYQETVIATPNMIGGIQAIAGSGPYAQMVRNRTSASGGEYLLWLSVSHRANRDIMERALVNGLMSRHNLMLTNPQAVTGRNLVIRG